MATVSKVPHGLCISLDVTIDFLFVTESADEVVSQEISWKDGMAITSSSGKKWCQANSARLVLKRGPVAEDDARPYLGA